MRDSVRLWLFLGIVGLMVVWSLYLVIVNPT